MRSIFRSLGLRGKAARRGRRRSWFSKRRVDAALERLEDRTLLSAGVLDPTFGLGGIVTTDFVGSNTDAGSAVAFQADGKIVVAGSTRERSNAEDFVVTRYNADGTLDTTFGTGGSAVTDVRGTGGYDYARGLAIDGQSRILVAGDSDQDFAVVRYLSDGTLDTSFGGDGIVVTEIGTATGRAEDVALDSQGRIIVAGHSNPGTTPELTVVRYNADGTLDSSFGGDGIVTAGFAGHNTYGHGVAVDASDRIVAAGYAHLISRTGTSSRSLLLARFDASGALDGSFDGDGWASRDLSGETEALNDLVIDASGRIVAAGVWSGNFIVARYSSTGALDTSFGGGIVTTDFGRYETANSLTIDGEGRIVVAGFSANDSQATAGDFALARYNHTNGSLDSGFDRDGKVVTDFNAATDRGEGVLVDSDGRIVAAGVAGLSGINSSDLAVAGYTVSGALDGAFGGDGRVTTDILGSTTDRIEGLALQSDGKIIAVGTSQDFATSRGYVARYHASGALDTTFGSAGTVRIDFGGHQFDPREVLIDASGRIIVVGRAAEDFALIAFDSTGAVDTSFGTGGRVTTDFNNGSGDYPSAATLDAQGRIVVAGYGCNTVVTNDGSRPDFLLARYSSDGTLDSTFGTGGTVVTDFALSSDIAMDVAIDSQGRIVVGGYAYMGTTNEYDFAVARYDSSGALDLSFNGDGRATVHLPGGGTANDWGWGVAVDSADRIVLAGRTNTSTTRDDFALVRLSTDGTLDTSFDTDGIVISDFAAGDDLVGAVAVDATGKILVTGAAQTSTSFRDFAVARYNADGTLDTAFGNQGWTVTDIGGLTNSSDWASEIWSSRTAESSRPVWPTCRPVISISH